jgi:chemotaxis methyl-accepting protein methylase
MKDFADLVKDKNVLLIGNSSSIKNKDYSELIDSYEFVIR